MARPLSPTPSFLRLPLQQETSLYTKRKTNLFVLFPFGKNLSQLTSKVYSVMSRTIAHLSAYKAWGLKTSLWVLTMDVGGDDTSIVEHSLWNKTWNFTTFPNFWLRFLVRKSNWFTFQVNPPSKPSFRFFNLLPKKSSSYSLPEMLCSFGPGTLSSPKNHTKWIIIAYFENVQKWGFYFKIDFFLVLWPY